MNTIQAARSLIDTYDSGYGQLAKDIALNDLKDALKGPQWSGLSVTESLNLIKQYEDRPLELLEAAESILRDRNT